MIYKWVPLRLLSHWWQTTMKYTVGVVEAFDAGGRPMLTRRVYSMVTYSTAVVAWYNAPKLFGNEI